MAKKVELTSLDELLGNISGQTPMEDKEGKIVRLPLHKVHDFEDHPFRVQMDESMDELVESIKRHGVLNPGIARPHKTIPGEYEAISGHRRKLGSKLAGEKDMPFIVKDLTDDEATVIMVDSNIQREDLLPSEKAKAYRMKYDALKRLGKTDDAGRNDAKLAKEAGVSRNTIQRYIRLTYLIDKLLFYVDQGKLPMNVGEILSHLSKDAQKLVLEVIERLGYYPTIQQAEKMKELHHENNLSVSVIELILEKKVDEKKVSLREKEIRKYFPETYTGKQIEAIIYSLLEEWKSKDQNRL